MIDPVFINSKIRNQDTKMTRTRPSPTLVLFLADIVNIYWDLLNIYETEIRVMRAMING